MRRPTLATLPLILVLVAHTACEPPAPPRVPSPAPAVNGPLEIDENGFVTMNGEHVLLEKVTRCNPAAHAEVVLAKRAEIPPAIFFGVATLGEMTSLGAMFSLLFFRDISRVPLSVFAVIGGGQAVTVGFGIAAFTYPIERVHTRNAVNLYNQGRPPCGPPLAPAGPEKAR